MSEKREGGGGGGWSGMGAAGWQDTTQRTRKGRRRGSLRSVAPEKLSALQRAKTRDKKKISAAGPHKAAGPAALNLPWPPAEGW